MGAEVFYADGRTDGQTDMPKLTVAFRNFADAPKICITSSHVLCAFHIMLHLGGHVCRQICSRLPKQKSGHSKPRRALSLSLSRCPSQMTTFAFRHKCYSPYAEESCFDFWHRQAIFLLFETKTLIWGPNNLLVSRYEGLFQLR